jgi:hypothetical protein
MSFEKYPELQDEDGFVPFNNFRELGQNQYAARYADDSLDRFGYPNLGIGLRWKNLESGNYHDLKIHIDDLAEFHDRVNRHRNGE